MLLILLSGIVFANQVMQSNAVVLQEPKVIPIFIGEYFTGKVYVITETGSQHWCSYDAKVMRFLCKEIGN